MLGKKFGFLALICIVTAAVLISAPLSGIASAQCSWMSSLSVVQLFDNPHDYRWQGSWDPKFDPDWQSNYRSSSDHDYDVRCDIAYGCSTCNTTGTNTSTCR